MTIKNIVLDDNNRVILRIHLALLTKDLMAELIALHFVIVPRFFQRIGARFVRMTAILNYVELK